jgi:predicted TIM-barrel fold metal-dependent hydrolase
VIDVHTHFLTCEHWGSEYPRHWQPAYGGLPWTDVTPTAFDAAMREGGVGTAVVFGLRASRAGVLTPHAELADFVARLQTPAVGFMALDLSDDDLLDQLDEGVAFGLRGVKLYPVLAHTDPRDPAHDTFYRRAADAGLVLLWHMGATPSGPSHPLVLDDVATRHPALTMVIAHMGHPWQRETVLLCRKHERVFTDVSAMHA